MPATSARIIREALSPDMDAIARVMAQWHASMQAVIRRAEQGLSGSISATLVAKLVCLHTLAPSLYDSARYDAQLLFALERASKGDESSDIYAEWANQAHQQPRLVTLLAMDPPFTHFDLRDLATALRLTSADDVLNATALDVPAMQALTTTGRARKVSGKLVPAELTSAAQHAQDAARAVEGQLVLSPALMSTALYAAIVFLLDRAVKLVIQSVPAVSSGTFIRPEFLTTNSSAGGLWGGGLGVGAELFGLALAILIAIFWGGHQRREGHSISLGLIIGALASNLFDRLAYGGVLNYVHLANLPVFNLSHIALVIGALMIAWSLLRGPVPATAESMKRA
jgi:lipoprotein signal peptidase